MASHIRNNMMMKMLDLDCKRYNRILSREFPSFLYVYYYALVGGAPRQYGSRRVFVCACVSVRPSVFPHCFYVMAEK